MTAQQLEQLFKFSKKNALGEENKENDVTQGRRGIGLFLCKFICESLNGNLQIESELGKGTKATFAMEVKTLGVENREKQYHDYLFEKAIKMGEVQ